MVATVHHSPIFILDGVIIMDFFFICANCKVVAGLKYTTVLLGNGISRFLPGSGIHSGPPNIRFIGILFVESLIVLLCCRTSVNSVFLIFCRFILICNLR